MKTLPSVSGVVKVLQAVGTVGPAHLMQGEIAINGKSYLIRVYDGGGYGLFSYDERKRETTEYRLAADLASCSCPDYAYRADRREDGFCKHCKSLQALRRAGKLPELVCEVVQVA